MEGQRRAEVLRELIAYRSDPSPLMQELASFGWDWPAEEPLAVLTRRDLLTVIERFLAGELSAAQLEDWAERLECREDLGFEPGYEGLVDDVFFRLATPCINEPLTPESVSRMRRLLLE